MMHFGDLNVAAIDKRIGGHIADFTIIISGQNPELLEQSGAGHHRIFRQHFYTGDARDILLQGSPLFNPGRHNFVMCIASQCQLASLVRNFGNGFQQNQTLLRCRQIHTTRFDIVCKGTQVKQVIGSPQRQFKTVFPFIRTMTQAGITSHFCECWCQ